MASLKDRLIYALGGQPTEPMDPSVPELPHGQRHGGSFATGLIDSAVSGFTLPRDVYEHGFNPEDDEFQGRLLDLTGLAQLGTFAAPATEAGGTVIGSGPVRTSKGQQLAKQIKAYHGSPHDFDKFSLEHIGKGEGAQAFGHGLYFADNPTVAQHYRDTLSRGNIKAMWDGSPVESWPPLVDDISKQDWRLGKLIDEYGRTGGDLSSFIQKSKDWYRGQPDFERAISDFEKRMVAEHTPGRMYEVGINADPETFLDWDALLKDQPQPVKDMFGYQDAPQKLLPKDQLVRYLTKKGLENTDEPQDLGFMIDNDSNLYKMAQQAASRDREAAALFESGELTPGDWVQRQAQPYLDALSKHNKTGGELYRQLVTDYENQQNASRQLLEKGVPGIRYYDAGSRLDGDGTRNYVVFNDDLVEILKKYGIAGLAALPASMLGTALTGQQEDDRS